MTNEDLTRKAQEYIASETNPFFADQVKELLASGNFTELNDRFFTDLEFGTGGLRGVIGGGSNRMNPWVVRRATQGLANYIKKTAPGAGASAVIAFDSRNFSDTFAREAALVFCANGIKTFLFSSLRPTPELSFAVRHCKATAGIVITASHNPAKYNGYKVYWNDGGQIVAPHDAAIIKEVLAVGSSITAMPYADAVSKGVLKLIDADVDKPYIDMIKNQALRPKLIREKGGSLTVVYTPLHGSGKMPVERVLREMGIDVTFVEEQKEPNGDFPTVNFPNPEEASAMKLALELAARVKADLVLGTDPDSDRLGIAVPDDGAYTLVTGNQLGALIADYIFSTRKELGSLPEKPAFVTTIVSSGLLHDVVRHHGGTTYETLTGFKYIAEKIRQFESETSGPRYLFGCEESYGYLVGTAVRDKDAVSAAAMAVEMALYHVSRGTSVARHLQELYRRHGYYREALVSKYFEGESGLAAMKRLMERLRTRPPSTMAGSDVVCVRDYLSGQALSLPDGVATRIEGFPPSNVLQFILKNGSIITARPSGTEPKVKFYASCRSEPGLAVQKAREIVDRMVDQITGELNRLASA